MKWQLKQGNQIPRENGSELNTQTFIVQFYPHNQFFLKKNYCLSFLIHRDITWFVTINIHFKEWCKSLRHNSANYGTSSQKKSGKSRNQEQAISPILETAKPPWNLFSTKVERQTELKRPWKRLYSRRFTSIFQFILNWLTLESNSIWFNNILFPSLAVTLAFNIYRKAKKMLLYESPIESVLITSK